MNFRGTRQPFGRPHQAKPGAVIAVQIGFRSRPDITGAVLRQGQDDLILKPFGHPIVPETVLLRQPHAGKPQEEHHSSAESTTAHHTTSCQVTYRRDYG